MCIRDSNNASEAIEYKLINTIGETVLAPIISYGKYERTIDVSGLPPGLYVLLAKAGTATEIFPIVIVHWVSICIIKILDC